MVSTSTASARKFVLPSLLTLAAGGFMTAGGYLFHTIGWHRAGLVMLPSGPIISIAFALLARLDSTSLSNADPDRSQPTSRSKQIRTVAIALTGLPSPGADVPLLAQIGASGLTILAGAIMFLAGYAVAAWSWMVVPPIVIAGAAVITAAFIVARTDSKRTLALASRPDAVG